MPDSYLGLTRPKLVAIDMIVLAAAGTVQAYAIVLQAMPRTDTCLVTLSTISLLIAAVLLPLTYTMTAESIGDRYGWLLIALGPETSCCLPV